MSAVDVDHAVAVAELDDTLVDAFALAVGLNEPWRAQAACADKPLGTWFPIVSRGQQRGPLYAEAKAVCHACPVQTECALFAIRNDVRDGCYGGLDPIDRKQMRQIANGVQIEHGTPTGYSHHRCRCEACRDAYESQPARVAYNAQRRAQAAARRVANTPIVHGTPEGFIERFCGCTPCRKAWQADQARKRAEEAA